MDVDTIDKDTSAKAAEAEIDSRPRFHSLTVTKLTHITSSRCPVPAMIYRLDPVRRGGDLRRCHSGARGAIGQLRQ
jgi:hypothetical protein